MIRRGWRCQGGAPGDGSSHWWTISMGGKGFKELIMQTSKVHLYHGEHLKFKLKIRFEGKEQIHLSQIPGSLS